LKAPRRLQQVSEVIRCLLNETKSRSVLDFHWAAKSIDLRESRIERLALNFVQRATPNWLWLWASQGFMQMPLGLLAAKVLNESLRSLDWSYRRWMSCGISRISSSCRLRASSSCELSTQTKSFDKYLRISRPGGKFSVKIAAARRDQRRGCAVAITEIDSSIDLRGQSRGEIFSGAFNSLQFDSSEQQVAGSNSDGWRRREMFSAVSQNEIEDREMVKQVNRRPLIEFPPFAFLDVTAGHRSC
jgi:hypothetical protein